MAGVTTSSAVRAIRVPRRRRSVFAGWAGMVGACLYSWFLAAPLFETRLDPAQAYVSELVVPGSPGSTVFRGADIVAGLLIIVLAGGLWSSTKRSARRSLGAPAVAVVGAAAIVDGAHPMTCAPSVDPACRLAEESLSLAGQLTDLHTVSGVVGALAAAVAMVASGGRPARGPAGAPPWWAGPACAAAVLSLGGVLAVLALAGGAGVGVVEHLQLLLVAGWLAVLSATLIGR